MNMRFGLCVLVAFFGLVGASHADQYTAKLGKVTVMVEFLNVPDKRYIVYCAPLDNCTVERLQLATNGELFTIFNRGHGNEIRFKKAGDEAYQVRHIAHRQGGKESTFTVTKIADPVFVDTRDMTLVISKEGDMWPWRREDTITINRPLLTYCFRGNCTRVPAQPVGNGNIYAKFENGAGIVIAPSGTLYTLTYFDQGDKPTYGVFKAE